eukprot:scaffold28601_cov40-Phaeocystis_antarctica.AAC.2
MSCALIHMWVRTEGGAAWQGSHRSLERPHEERRQREDLGVAEDVVQVLLHVVGRRGRADREQQHAHRRGVVCCRRLLPPPALADLSGAPSRSLDLYHHAMRHRHPRGYWPPAAHRGRPALPSGAEPAAQAQGGEHLELGTFDEGW